VDRRGQGTQLEVRARLRNNEGPAFADPSLFLPVVVGYRQPLEEQLSVFAVLFVAPAEFFTESVTV
jgi:hypothetical protein